MDGAPPILEFARARAGEGESVWLGEEHGSEFESREEAPRHFCDGAVSGGHKSRNSAENVGENDDDDAENNDGKAVVDQVEIGRLSPSGERNHATRFPIDLAQSSTISPPAFAPSMVSEHLRHPESNFGGFQHQKDTVISHVRPGDHGLEQENAKDQGAEVAALKNVQGRKQSIQLPPKHVGQHHHVGVPRDDDPSHEIDAFLKIFEDEESAAGAERPPTVAYNNAAVDFQQQQVQPQHHHQHIHSQQFNRQQFQSWQEQDVLHRIALPVAASQQRFLYYRQQHQQQPHHHHYHQQQQHHQKLVDEAGRVAHLGQQGLPKGMFAYEFPKYPAEVATEMSLNKMPQVAYMRRRLPHEMSRYEYVANDMAAANQFYGNQHVVLGVPLVMGGDEHGGGPHNNKRRKNTNMSAAAASAGAHPGAYKRHKVQSHPLDARTIPYLGKSKISRLASLGVLTVEDLANVNPDDRRLAVAATTNNRSDHAKRTLQRWRDKAVMYLSQSM